MTYTGLPVPFPWYDKKEQQNRYGENVVPVCDFKLVTPRDALLPFQFRVPPMGFAPNSWAIYRQCDDVQVAQLLFSIPLLRINKTAGYEYYSYDGSPLTTMPVGPLDLECGFYYSKISWYGGLEVVSEVFYVPESRFSVVDTVLPYVKMQWWNDCDISPLRYQSKGADGRPFFIPTLYLDSFIHQSEPVMEIVTTPDGENTEIPTFYRLAIPFRVSALVPDFLKRALASMQMHEHLHIVDKEMRYEGFPEQVAVEAAPQVFGALNTVDMLFTDVIMVKGSCCTNMANDCSGTAATINSVLTSEGSVQINATMPSGTSVYVYASMNLTDPPVLVYPLPLPIMEDDGNVLIAAPSSIFEGYNYVILVAREYGCEYPPSNRFPLADCEGMTPVIGVVRELSAIDYTITGNVGDTAYIYKKATPDSEPVQVAALELDTSPQVFNFAAAAFQGYPFTYVITRNGFCNYGPSNTEIIPSS